MNRVEEPYDLTPLQRKYLQRLRDFCRTPPTLLKIYSKNVPRYLLLGLGIGLLVSLCILNDMQELTWFLGGMFAGIAFLDLAQFNNAIKLWPATTAILDQEKMAELLQEHHEPADWL